VQLQRTSINLFSNMAIVLGGVSLLSGASVCDRGITGIHAEQLFWCLCEWTITLEKHNNF